MRKSLKTGFVFFALIGSLIACSKTTNIPVPDVITAVPGQNTGDIVVTWPSMDKELLNPYGTQSLQYNLYWSNSPGVTVETATKIPNVTSPYTHSGLTLGQTYYYKMSASLKVTGTSQQPTLTEGDISDNEISSLPATPSPNFNRMPLPPIGGSGGGSGGVGGFPNFGGYGGGGSGGVGGTGGSGISCSVTSPLSGAFKVSMTPTITVVCSGLTAGRVSGSLTPSSGGTSIVLNELMCMSGDPSCPPPNAGYYKPQTSLSPATLYCTSFTGLTDPSGQAVIIPQSCFTTRQPILIQEMP